MANVSAALTAASYGIDARDLKYATFERPQYIVLPPKKSHSASSSVTTLREILSTEQTSKVGGHILSPPQTPSSLPSSSSAPCLPALDFNSSPSISLPSLEAARAALMARRKSHNLNEAGSSSSKAEATDVVAPSSSKRSSPRSVQGHSRSASTSSQSTVKTTRSSSSSSASYDAPSSYMSLRVSNSDPIHATFSAPDGRSLFRTVTKGRTTVIRRTYGRSASSNNGGGVVLAEIEWMDRVRSSRVRFAGCDVDIRVDEWMKGTNGGSGQSKMFASADGRTFKWKVNDNESAELYECANGKRISNILASSSCQPAPSASSSLLTPPPTPPLTLPSSPASLTACFSIPSIEITVASPIVSDETHLRIHNSALPLIDQVVVTWIIMERDRLLRQATNERP